MAFISWIPLFPCSTRGTKRVCMTSGSRSPPVAGTEYAVDPDSRDIFSTFELPPRVALTREEGKNEPLRKALTEIFSFIEVQELPCVRSITLEGALELPDRLVNLDASNIEWIVLTSPEAAMVFINSWRTAGCPNLPQLAVVGKATGACLHAVGLDVAFEPTKATGRTLVKEFPSPEPHSKGSVTVLYPASLKASNDVQQGLTKRGYSVERINTYSTEITHFSEEDLFLAKDVHIVTFASPSAVKGWVQNVGVNPDLAVACIGETSARASKEAGFTQVHYPDAPGLDGWVTAVCEAMKVFENSHGKHKS